LSHTHAFFFTCGLKTQTLGTDDVGMAFTGRLSSGKLTPSKGHHPSTGNQTGEEIARAARVEQLRRLVAAGKYQVEPKRLAARILARALIQQS
jgi:hypothetical protein